MAAVVLVALLTNAAALAAQEPRGAGPDARTAPAGTLRIGLAATWERDPEQYVGSGAGSLRTLGSKFSFDTLGSNVFATLGPVESAARAASGIPTFRASLGRSVVKVRNYFETTPFFAEYGITSRLSLGVMVPLVTATTRVDATVNPLGREATVGFNPAYFAVSAATGMPQLLAQFDSAATFISQRLAICAAQPSGTGCTAINASAATARALTQQSAAFATALGSLYGGRNGTKGAPFVPVAGTAAQAAIDARVAGFRTQYAALGASGITAPSPQGAAPITAAGLQTILTDSAYGINSKPLGAVVRRGVGDIDLTAQYTWHDSHARATTTGSRMQRAWWRSAVAGTFRLGTGANTNADDLIPVPTGDHQNDFEVRSLTDIGFGTAASLTTVLRYTMQMPSSLQMRIPGSPGDPFPEAFRTATVTRNAGDEMALDLYPRWNLSEAMSIAGRYSYRSRGADAYTGTVAGTNPAGTTVTASASVLDAPSAAKEHRLGAIVAYSTVAAWSQGKARWPIEISAGHFQTTAGLGGTVPKLSYDEVQVRWYWRPFGRPAAPASR